MPLPAVFHLFIRSQSGLDPTPALKKILARGDALPALSSLSAGLCEVWNLARQQDWPMAALSAPVPQAAKQVGYWLRLDPVHLEVGMRGMFVRSGMTLDASENRQLQALLETVCFPHGLKLLYSDDGITHIHLDTLPDLRTTALDEAENRQAAQGLPKGESAPFWAHLLNEIQMKLHEHPLNQAREARGELPINSLWLWGGGVLPGVFTPLPVHLHARAAWIQTCATGLGLRIAPPPSAFTHLSPARRHVVVLDDLQGDSTLPGHLEQRWFAPLLQALNRGRIKRLHLNLLTDHPTRVSIGPAQSWRFWR